MMALFKFLAPFVLLYSLLGAAWGGEVDQFSMRDVALEDSRERINEHLNHYLRRAIREINESEPERKLEPCGDADKERLYRQIRMYLLGSPRGLILSALRKDENVQMIRMKKKDSINRVIGFKDGFLWRLRGGSLSPILRVGEVRIGLDKLGHMLGIGGSGYFKRRLRGERVERILVRGILAEKRFLGGNSLATGVVSYADLAANFSGLLFWDDLLERREKILPERNLGPYITCEDSRYALIQEVDIGDYVNSAFDEAINCSRYARPKTARKVAKEIQSLGMRCPLQDDKLYSLRDRYGPYSKFVLNLGDEGFDFTKKGAVIRNNLQIHLQSK